MKIYTNRYHDFTPSQGIPVRITYGFATMATSVHNRSIGENSDAGPMVHGGNRRRIHRTVSCHAGLTRGRPLDTPVVETTGFLRTGLAWIQAIRLNPEASHF